MATQGQGGRRPASGDAGPSRDIIRELDPDQEIKAGYWEQGRRRQANEPPGSERAARRGADRGPYYDLLDAALDFGGQVTRTTREAARRLLREGSGRGEAELSRQRQEGVGWDTVRQLFLEAMRRLMPEESRAASSSPGAAPEVAGLTLPPASPGNRTSTDLDVQNTSPEWVNGLRLRCPALVTADGSDRILGHHVTFHPGIVNVAPQQASRVQVRLEVPPEAKRGSYMGLIEADGLPGMRSLITIDVV